jgi:hypothetical protein
MSFQITAAFVQQYSANIYMLSQQKGSRLRGYCRAETIQGTQKGFDRVGLKSARKKTTRHENTPQQDTPHSRRWVQLADYDDGDLIDDLDKIRLLNDPTSEYMLATAWALGRSMDDTFIAAADGTAVTGQNADTSTAFTDGQRIIANDGAGNSANMNVETLRKMKLRFDQADVDDSLQRHIAVTGSQLYSLLALTQVTSADYNTVKALANGSIDTFMGFKFHRLERLAKQAVSKLGSFANGDFASGSDETNGFRKVIAWVEPSMIIGIGKDITGRISERADKCFSVQTYGSMSLGSVRMEEVGVVIAFCDETK